MSASIRTCLVEGGPLDGASITLAGWGCQLVAQRVPLPAPQTGWRWHLEQRPCNYGEHLYLLDEATGILHYQGQQ